MNSSKPANAVFATLLSVLIAAGLLYLLIIYPLERDTYLLVVILLALATLAFMRSLQAVAQPGRLTVDVRFNSELVGDQLSRSEYTLMYAPRGADRTYPRIRELPPGENTRWDLPVSDLFLLDRNLALAKVRIDIERELRRIASEADLVEPKRPLPLGRLLAILTQRQLLPSELVDAIRDITSVANVAVHGGEVPEDTAAQVTAAGKVALDQLQRLGPPGPNG